MNAVVGTGTVMSLLGRAGVGPLAVISRVDFVTFWVCAVIIVVGAVGVVLSRHPVHAALMLIMTLFAVAVLFIEQDANFLAAIQVIVYAGAIVVLFLFVIMFLGVDRREDLSHDPLRGQRVVAPILVALGLAGVLVLGVGAHWATGAHSVVGPARGQPGGDVAALGRAVFTVYLFPFEITVGLLVTAIVGAVVLARRPSQPAVPDDEAATGDAGDPAPSPPPASLRATDAEVPGAPAADAHTEAVVAGGSAPAGSTHTEAVAPELGAQAADARTEAVVAGGSAPAGSTHTATGVTEPGAGAGSASEPGAVREEVVS